MGIPAGKPSSSMEKTVAEKVYTVIHEALDAYAEHWSSLGDKADEAGASITDVQGTNDYDFMETIKAIAWSYFPYEAGRCLDPYLEQYVSRDIIVTLKQQDKVNRRRMGKIAWDEKAAKEGQHLDQYLKEVDCGQALESFLIKHFMEGKEQLQKCLAPLAKYAKSVSTEEYKQIVYSKYWKKAMDICQRVFLTLFLLSTGILAIYYIPIYIAMAVAFIVLLILYIIKRDKRIIESIYVLLVSAVLSLARFLPEGGRYFVYGAVLIAIVVMLILDTRRKQK